MILWLARLSLYGLAPSTLEGQVPHRHLAAAGAILTLCMPVTSSAFGLDLACQGYLLLPDSDSKLVEQLGCPAAYAGMVSLPATMIPVFSRP